LPQKAGVPQAWLRRLALKELVDNALDVSSEVSVGPLDDTLDRFFVQDQGPGVAGGPDAIARQFSINRPLVSTKLWRLPTRGALGNGLRVVMGSVIASGGSLTVMTHNQRVELTPQDDGSTAAVTTPIDFPLGTRIEIAFGPALPRDPRALEWAKLAIVLSRGGPGYTGRTSPFWYSAGAFYELLRAAGPRPVRELVTELDGCTGAKAGLITGPLKGVNCAEVPFDQAAQLLARAREHAKPVRPDRLGAVGDLGGTLGAHARMAGTYAGAGVEFPVVVEAWASARGREDKSEAAVAVNRTPVTGLVQAWKEKAELNVRGCGLFIWPKGGSRAFRVLINVTTPYCPITTYGKEPDLSCFADNIEAAIKKACKRASAELVPSSNRRPASQKGVILDSLDDAVDKAGGDGRYRFSLRQLFYVVRPRVMQACGAELMYPHFEAVIADFENDNGLIPGLYRDPRGTLYHPHTRQSIPLGTIAVEQYRRPEWTFGRLLYSEKEGLLETLKADDWPERNDCALVSSKGFTTRAVRDLLDLLGDDGEPIKVFCIHDADAAGTMIYETLVEETRARAKRRIEVVNLGLEPWQALAMGLEPEKVERSERRTAVADYVVKRPDGARWAAWLERHRVELNEMPTPQFVAWLDSEMANHEGGKVIPPEEVAVDRYKAALEAAVRERETERILEEAGMDDVVDETLRGLEIPDGADLLQDVSDHFKVAPQELWAARVNSLAREAASP
jgi:DNA topoisomerase 6 subunit A-like protein